MQRSREGFIRLSGILGIGAIMALLGTIVVSWFFSPWFSLTSMAFSDLGVYGTYRELFSYGIMITGALALCFAGGLTLYLPKEVKLAGFFMVVGSFALFFVGVFPKGPLHIGAVVLMMGCFAVALAVIAGLYRDRVASHVAALALIVGCGSVVALNYISGFAVSELVVFVCLGFVLGFFSVKMMANPKPGKN